MYRAGKRNVMKSFKRKRYSSRHSTILRPGLGEKRQSIKARMRALPIIRVFVSSQLFSFSNKAIIGDFMSRIK